MTSDNSHYSIVKDLLLKLSTERRNFSPQGGRHKMSTYDIWLPPLRTQVPNAPIGIRNRKSETTGGGEGTRTPDPRVANAVLCQLSYTPDKNSNFEIRFSKFRGWLRGRDLNPRPLGYEPNELPDCSTPRQINSSRRLTSEISNLRSEIRNGGPG